MMLKIPDLPMLASWLNQKNLESYLCDDCHSLHLSHLKKMEAVFDAKLELTDDIISFSISSEIKSSAITTLLAELSQINLSSSLLKAYLDIPDDMPPKIVFRHVLDCAEGVTEAQFSSFITRVEEEALQIISELNHYDLLDKPEQITDDVEALLTRLHTYH